jgi:hypothetical protein
MPYTVVLASFPFYFAPTASCDMCVSLQFAKNQAKHICRINSKSAVGPPFVVVPQITKGSELLTDIRKFFTAKARIHSNTSMA